MAKKVIRLYEQFKPSNYQLLLDLDKVNLKFSGQVKVTGLKTGRPSKRITFHQKGLKFSSAKITKLGKAAQVLTIDRINKHDSLDEVRLHTKELVYPGEYEVEINFSGKITKSMHGIYPSFYKDKGKEKSLLGTQFESHSAREAFPCIDEPEAKATFNLSLLSPKGETALSNMPLKSSSVSDGRLKSVFEPTPIMSSYLLAFVVGEMHYSGAKTKDGIEVKSWAHSAHPIKHLDYATKEAVKILEFFSDYFKTPFPLKKLDLAALPEFDSLAMENWGLITFREMGLLSDPTNSSLSSNQLISLVIAHEVSHQWFGNLVTMKWWDDLWLNESFASLMENLAPDRLHPDWHQWEDFATGRVLSCSHRDIYKDVQPVGVKVKHPDEIYSIFDPAIVYAKGARLLSMLFDYVGEDNFRKGLQLYFKKNAYKNTTRDDLWAALSSVCGQDIGKLMTPWIEQSGQPLLKVKSSGQKISLNQKRFLLDGEDNTSLWPLPLLSDIKLSKDIIYKRQDEVTFKGTRKPIFNVNGSGHYIVKYEDKQMFDSLVDRIIKQDVSSISRITLINDMLLLARAGDYSLSPLLEIVRKGDKEPRDAVWSMFMRIVGQAQTLTDGLVQTETDIRSYKKQLSNYWYKKLGWNDKPADDPNTRHLRTTALALSLAGENKDAIDRAISLYESTKSVEKLPADHRAIIAGTVIRHGDSKYIDLMMSEYVSSLNPEVHNAITAALCTAKDPKIAQKLINWGLKPGGTVRQQDIDHWYAYLMRNHYTREVAWDWFTNNWSYITELFSGAKHMEYFVWYSAGPMSTPEWQKKFKDFFGPKREITSLERNINISLSEIEARVAWRKREETALVSYFSNLTPR